MCIHEMKEAKEGRDGKERLILLFVGTTQCSLLNAGNQLQPPRIVGHKDLEHIEQEGFAIFF